jgi:uncharacterized protein
MPKKAKKRRSPRARPQTPQFTFADLDAPLDGSELDDLRSFLSSANASGDGMTISMLHGFFCAIVSGPIVPPSEWLPVIWGDGEPVFDGEAHANRIIALLMRFQNEVAAEILLHPLRFEPLLDVRVCDGVEEVDGEAWCVGYGIGMTTHADAWQELVQDAGTAMFFYPIMALATLGSDPDNDELTNPEAYQLNVAALGKCAGVIYMLWRDRDS